MIGLTFWQTWLTEMGRDKGGEEEPGPQPKHDEVRQPSPRELRRTPPPKEEPKEPNKDENQQRH